MAYTKQGFVDGNVLSASQLEKIEDGIIASQVDPAECDLPILYLSGWEDGINGTDYVVLNYAYNGMSGNCDIKWQGSSSLAYAKKNYTIKFDQKFEAAEGWGLQKKYCLKANYIDHSHARNVVCAKLWGQVVKSRNGEDEVRDALLKSLPNGGAVDGFPVVIMMNGRFHGVYTFNIPKDDWMFGLGDTDELGSNQAIVGADKNTAATQFRTANATLSGEDNFELEYSSGAGEIELTILKTNTNITSDGSESYLENFSVTNNVSINHSATYTLTVAAGCADEHVRLAEYNADGVFLNRQLLTHSKKATAFDLTFKESTAYVRLCTNKNDFQYLSLTSDAWVAGSLNAAIEKCASGNLDAVKEVIDWSSAVDYYIFTILIGGHDCVGKNYLLMTIGDGKKWTFSAYDMDSTFGLDWNGKSFLKPSNCTPTVTGANCFYTKVGELVRDKDTETLKSRYAELRAGVLSEENVANEFLNFCADIPKVLLGEDDRVWNGVPSSSVNTVDQMLNWYRLRVAIIDAQIAAL